MKIIIEKEKRDKPLKKGICLNCESKMIKRKDKTYHCMKCGNKVDYKKKK